VTGGMWMEKNHVGTVIDYWDWKGEIKDILIDFAERKRLLSTKTWFG
jgi:hypothetical protein